MLLMFKNFAFYPYFTLYCVFSTLGLIGRLSCIGLALSASLWLKNYCWLFLYLLAAALISLSCYFLTLITSSCLIFFSGKLLLPLFLKWSYLISTGGKGFFFFIDFFFPSSSDKEATRVDAFLILLVAVEIRGWEKFTDVLSAWGSCS